MKILVAGDWHSELHEEAVAHALETLGHTIERFAWHGYFSVTGHSVSARLLKLWCRAQNKYLWGGRVDQLNRDLISVAKRFQPDAIFIYRGTHVFPKSLRALRAVVPRVVLVGYNNDDPFAPGHVPGLWRHFIAGLPELDLALAYRHANLEDFRLAGARRVELLRSWYIPERNHPVELSAQERESFGCDVVFIGHYEPDSRLACLEAAVSAGYQVRLYGPGYEWEPVLNRHPVLSRLLPVRLVWGDEYNLALCGAKIALVFLSRLNRDTYTRRCFEIPATGTMMLAEYTDDLASLYCEGREVEFFRDPAEMENKIKHYLADDMRRGKLAADGQRRVYADGHDVNSRMRQMLTWVTEIRERRI
ncbi:MAG: glycosyltransferase [Thiobacillus sp.]